MPLRCCRDSLTIEQGKGHRATEGLEIPCRWCECHWTYTGGQWVHTDPLARRIDRMASGIASPEYATEKARLIGTPRLYACVTCGHPVLMPPFDNICPNCLREFADAPRDTHTELQGTVADVQMDLDQARGKQWKDI